MIYRLQFAGIINKVEIKQAGQKQLAEISLVRKNYAKAGDPDTFTWVRVALWEPKDWQLAKLVKGAFIAGSGEFSLRSYEKDGAKRQSAEVRCSSFDVEVGEVGQAQPAQERHAQLKATMPPKPAAGDTADDEPPF